jgi:hypothetical protein
MGLIDILIPQPPKPIVGARLVRLNVDTEPPKPRAKPTGVRPASYRAKQRRYQRKRRARLVAAGLTTKGGVRRYPK